MFLGATLVIVRWAIGGPIFRFSDTWQLVIKHQHNDRDLPDGVPHPGHPEPGQCGGAAEAG
jgi:hypothetical protein